MTQNSPNPRLNIAIIPNKLLGDGIIALILANNLFINHFKVTIFQDFITPFQAWLPFDVLPINKETINMDILNTYDIVLADTYSKFTDRYTIEEIETIAKEIIFYSTGKLKRQYQSNPLNFLRKKLTGDKAQFIPLFSTKFIKLC